MELEKSQVAKAEQLKNPLLEDGVLKNPYEALAQLRREDPVFYCNQLEGWVLTRYEDIASTFRNPSVVAGNFRNQVENYMQNHRIDLVEDYLRVRTKMMLHNDGQEQLRLRRPCRTSFNQRGLEVLKPAVDLAVQETIAALPRSGAWDFATDFAEPLSTRVIAGLFDIPHEDRKDFQRYSDDVSRFFGNSVENIEQNAKTANDGILFLEEYFQALLIKCKKKPGKDLLSLLVSANESLLSDDEIIAQCVLILMAGHFTVIDQLCNSAHAFIHHGLWSQLAATPNLLSGAIEESIRFDGGVLFMARTVAAPVLIGGKALAVGDTVFLGLGAANRDPAQFDQPDRFLIDRSPSQHMGFGYGAHQCIGMGLARVEIHAAFLCLMQKFPNLKFDQSAPGKRKAESLFFRGFYNLSVHE